MKLKAKVTTLDYKAAITILLVVFDFVSRLLTSNYVQPIYFDSLVTLSVGFWFGKAEK